MLQKEITDFLESLPNIYDSKAQRALIEGAGLDAELQSQIYFEIPPAQFFQLLVPMLLSYGLLKDGRNPLDALLQSAQNRVGQDRKVYCDSLINRLHANT